MGPVRDLPRPSAVHPGDVLESEVEGLGVMRNKVVAED
jgi:2-keto-4-pentenoate hydratase/2-oxohepta-3-ene-1,7-dioic acid hydratase in catechol pathway